MNPAGSEQGWISIGPASRIRHHGSSCCTAACHWLVAHHVASGGDLGLSWVGELFGWGPVQWPLAWCDLIGRDVGDCGVHASVAEMVLRETGHACRRVQLAVRYSSHELSHWRCTWDRSAVDSSWIKDGWCYHEAVAVGDQDLTIVDATEPTRWTDPVLDGVLALRIGCTSQVELADVAQELLRWGSIPIRCGQWVNFTQSNSAAELTPYGDS